MENINTNKLISNILAQPTSPELSIILPCRNEEQAIIHCLNQILDTLEKEKGNLTLKGDLIKNTFVTSSMGVSYKVKLGKVI